MVSSWFAPHYVAWKASRCGRFIGDTHGSRVFVFPMKEHRADQTAAASEALVECNVRSCKLQSKFVKSKVLSFLFLRFRILRKFNFGDLAFFDFSIPLTQPPLVGMRMGATEKTFALALGLFALYASTALRIRASCQMRSIAIVVIRVRGCHH